MAKQQTQRLDLFLLDVYPQYSRQQVQSWIMQGKVTINGTVANKSGYQVKESDEVLLVIQEPKYVSRAGYKLEKALDYFGIEIHGKVCLDAGISTGGFTDCLLQHGAQKVYGIDVGYGQVHEKIRQDERVVLYERTNLRELRSVGEPVDCITIDLSFISVLKVMDAITALLKTSGTLVVLIKPQFEATRDQVGRGGIIKDSAVHQDVIERVVAGIQAYGFVCRGIIESPILGATGNKEFLAYFIRSSVYSDQIKSS